MAQDAAFVAADIPGLIEGASEGAGLGHNFLRHVQRCRLLIHVVDISGREGRDPIDDILAINYELEQFDPELAKRPQIVAANKTDLLEEGYDLTDFEDFISVKGYDLVYISVATHKDIKKLVNLAYQKLQELPPIKVYETEYVEPEKVIDKTDHSVSVTYENGVYYVEGEWLFHVMQSVNFEDRQSLMYFQRVLKNNGVIEALEKAGCGDGDTVSLYDFEFDFVQ